MEAFPVESPKVLQSPPVPDVEGALNRLDSTPSKPLYRIATILFVIVAVVGAVAAGRFFVAAAHQSAPAQE
jgi:hypothetical protein